MSRHILRFRHSDTGLTPTFTFFKKVLDLSTVAPAPAIVEIGSGSYYFDYTPTFDITFEIDGGASIPTEEVRYISDTISPRDTYLDEPISQVHTDVWSDNVTYAAGTKGLRVDQLGDPSDTSAASTLFGKTLLYKEAVRGDAAGGSGGSSVKAVYDRIGAPAGASLIADLATAVSSVKGADSRDLSQIAGSGWAAPANTLKTIAETVGLVPGSTSVAEAVWDVVASGHLTAGTTGAALVAGAQASDITAAVASIKGGGNVDNSQIYTRLGAPAGASLAADIAAIKADTGTINSSTGSLGTLLIRALGLMHENSVLDQTIYDGANNLTSGRLRIYNTKANTLGAGATGLLETYTISASYVGDNVQTYTVVREGS